MGNRATLRRLLEPALLDRLRRAPVVVLTGARQTGKTTLVRSFDGASERTFETLDSLSTLDRARREPEVFIESPAPMTIDEVQRAPDLLIAIKHSIDRERRPGRFLLTGSANLALMAGVGESLAGRALYLVLRPMTEREKRGEPHQTSWADLLSARSAEAALQGVPPLRPFDPRRAALEGGLPPAALAPDPSDRRLWLEGYFDTYVKRDLRDFARIGDLAAFVRLARLVALRNGGLVNESDLARDAAIPRTTAQRWLSILEASYLHTSLEAFATSRSKRLIKAPKSFFGDTGLGLHLAGLVDEEAIAAAPNSGAWLENLVLNDMLAWRETEVVKPGIHHRRTVGGEEIDFVVEAGHRLLPVEVKSRGTVRVADATGIDSFCREHGPSRAPFGLVLHGGRDAIRLTRHAVAVPLGAMI